MTPNSTPKAVFPQPSSSDNPMRHYYSTTSLHKQGKLEPNSPKLASILPFLNLPYLQNGSLSISCSDPYPNHPPSQIPPSSGSTFPKPFHQSQTYKYLPKKKRSHAFILTIQQLRRPRDLVRSSPRSKQPQRVRASPRHRCRHKSR